MAFKHIIRPCDGYSLPVAAWLGNGQCYLEFGMGHTLRVCGGYVVLITLIPSINKNYFVIALRFTDSIYVYIHIHMYIYIYIYIYIFIYLASYSPTPL